MVGSEPTLPKLHANSRDMQPYPALPYAGRVEELQVTIKLLDQWM